MEEYVGGVQRDYCVKPRRRVPASEGNGIFPPSRVVPAISYDDVFGGPPKYLSTRIGSLPSAPSSLLSEKGRVSSFRGSSLPVYGEDGPCSIQNDAGFGRKLASSSSMNSRLPAGSCRSNPLSPLHPSSLLPQESPKLRSNSGLSSRLQFSFDESSERLCWTSNPSISSLPSSPPCRDNPRDYAKRPIGFLSRGKLQARKSGGDVDDVFGGFPNRNALAFPQCNDARSDLYETSSPGPLDDIIRSAWASFSDSSSTNDEQGAFLLKVFSEMGMEDPSMTDKVPPRDVPNVAMPTQPIHTLPAIVTPMHTLEPPPPKTSSPGRLKTLQDWFDAIPHQNSVSESHSYAIHDKKIVSNNKVLEDRNMFREPTARVGKEKIVKGLSEPRVLSASSKPNGSYNSTEAVVAALSSKSREAIGLAAALASYKREPVPLRKGKLSSVEEAIEMEERELRDKLRSQRKKDGKEAELSVGQKVQNDRVGMPHAFDLRMGGGRRQNQQNQSQVSNRERTIFEARNGGRKKQGSDSQASNEQQGSFALGKDSQGAPGDKIEKQSILVDEVYWSTKNHEIAAGRYNPTMDSQSTDKWRLSDLKDLISPPSGPMYEKVSQNTPSIKLTGLTENRETLEETTHTKSTLMLTKEENLSLFEGPTFDGSQEADGEALEGRQAKSDLECKAMECVAKLLEEKQQQELEFRREKAAKEQAAETSQGLIMRWSTGKEDNLRALLSNLHLVLWPDSGWEPIPLRDLIDGASVKRSYRKAMLFVHPDKMQQKGATVDQEYLAEKVFNILQEAWKTFNTQELF